MTVILRTSARLVLPIILVLAVELHVSGHGEPGGGFVGGVLLASSIGLVLLAFGLDFLDEHVQSRVRTFYGLTVGGLLLAFSGGLAPMAFGGEFLAQYLLHPAGFEFSTALVFDTGILLSVSGAGGLLLSEVGGG